MKVINCAGGKGGTGKSSLSLLIAWELAKGKNRVAIADCDIQGTCISAKELNKDLPFDVFHISNKNELLARGKALSDQGYDFLVIDGNPRSIHEDPALIETIAKLSDLSLIVSRPSPRDLKAQLQYIDLVKLKTSGQIRLLWNFFQKTAGAHKDGITEGEKFLACKSLKSKISQRVVYQDVGFSEGYIGDLGNKDALAEVRALCKEVKELCNG